jgi:spore maturation protein CgeB
VKVPLKVPISNADITTIAHYLCIVKRRSSKMKSLKILVLESYSLQIPGMIIALLKLGHEAVIYPQPIEDIGGDEKKEKELEECMKNGHFDFVIANLFAPIAAKLTHELGIRLAVYGMDSPMYAYYLHVLPRYDNIYLFYFDRREYRMAQQMGYKNVYYMPLAGDIDSTGRMVVTDEEIKKYACDMSFVGGMYTENIYDRYRGDFSPEMQQYISEILEQSAFVWDGRDRIGEMLSPERAGAIRASCAKLRETEFELPDAYFVKALLFGRKLTQIERTLLMELLSERYDIRLYTWTQEEVPEGVRRFPAVDSAEETPKVFYASKININITLRSIETGIPARVFDIMSVGGFVLSNWQEEIPELFEEGKEIATFKTPEELVEKADYYLAHEEERVRIGINGYQKIKKCYTYEHRMKKIIAVLFPGL